MKDEFHRVGACLKREMKLYFKGCFGRMLVVEWFVRSLIANANRSDLVLNRYVIGDYS